MVSHAKSARNFPDDVDVTNVTLHLDWTTRLSFYFLPHIRSSLTNVFYLGTDMSDPVPYPDGNRGYFQTPLTAV